MCEPGRLIKREHSVEREGAGRKCTTNLAELSIYLLLRVQSSSIFNQSSSVKMYFRDFMQRELFVIKSSHTHTRKDLWPIKRAPPKKMEDTFYNTEFKNKIKKSEKERGKKNWPPWNKSSILRRERNTAEHRWEWCPFCVLCVSVRNSFRIAAVRAGAAGAAAPGLGGAAAAEPGRASGGSWARFLCGEEGSDVVTCKEPN